MNPMQGTFVQCELLLFVLLQLPSSSIARFGGTSPTPLRFNHATTIKLRTLTMCILSINTEGAASLLVQTSTLNCALDPVAATDPRPGLSSDECAARICISGNLRCWIVGFRELLEMGYSEGPINDELMHVVYIRLYRGTSMGNTRMGSWG